MAAEQTLIFTVMPRAVTQDGPTLPVSVFISVRLRGASRLAAFPDLRHWTRHLRTEGFSIELQCAGETHRARATAPGEPDLWEKLFKDDTLVKSHTFDDYSDRGIISYPVRDVLSTLKWIYQRASVDLALPPASPEGRRYGPRQRLKALIAGLNVNWSDRLGNALRDEWRMTLGRAGHGLSAKPSVELDSEGLDKNPSDDMTARQTMAQRFALFHHMPTPSPKKLPDLQPDWEKQFDFHQVLTALNAYPLLQRAMGLVFDLDLPRDFVALTPTSPGIISVSNVVAGWPWSIAPKVVGLSTAYLHYDTGSNRRFFLAAPRVLADPSAPTTVVGLLNLDPQRFGLAQVDVDGGMHKTIMLAESFNPDPGANVTATQPEAAVHPEIFDPEATLPSLRSGGFSLYADGRALSLLDSIAQNKGFNDAVETNTSPSRPLYTEDLVRGYRLDVWDSHATKWHSLHQRNGTYSIADLTVGPHSDEGFVQLAAVQPDKAAQPQTNDLYLHEAVARWAGWSLSAGQPGKHLSRYADPDKAIPPNEDTPEYRENEPVTPFKMKVEYKVVPGSLPALRFGHSYRFRARAVDLAGNSLAPNDPIADALSVGMALPQDPGGFTYLRYEPVAAPLVVMRDAAAVTGPGSAVDRIVIRTFNAGIEKDSIAADANAGDRHILPPRASVELGERLGMFDDATGHLKGDAATWDLIAKRDGAELHNEKFTVAGKENNYPIVAGARIDAVPYLPDPLSAAAAFRNLPGTRSGQRGEVSPGVGTSAPVSYNTLSDPNPRPGSATLVSFGGPDWQSVLPFRLVLADEDPNDPGQPPQWDPSERILTVWLPKGTMQTVPLTSYVRPGDLSLMGQWRWLREFVDNIVTPNPTVETLDAFSDPDRVAHVLQLAVEGAHWMLTPPRLLTFVHAVQQPLGRPEFTALNVTHIGWLYALGALQTAPILRRADPSELAPIVAWRLMGANEAYLVGALRVHGASSTKIDLAAAWDDPVDDVSQPKWSLVHHEAHADELPLHTLQEGYLVASGADQRRVGYYDPEHDQIAFMRSGDYLGVPGPSPILLNDAAPRHFFGDTKHRRVAYTATATSRYREYFDQGTNPRLEFTRSSEPVVVDIPASARPLAPSVLYVLPTFGWQRQTDTNLKRSVRFGGGLRIYCARPWFSSGDGELLGVSLWNDVNGPLDRDKFKPFITQWGMDPIWATHLLDYLPVKGNFSGASEMESGLELEETAAGTPVRVDVVGFAPQFDEARGLWFADLVINTYTQTYMPFVRLGLVRYQPHALPQAKLSRVILADFAQLTPDRVATVTSDPFHPLKMRVVVSGIAPTGPKPVVRAFPRPQDLAQRPTRIRVTVQQRDPSMTSDLGWNAVAAGVASITVTQDGTAPAQPDLELFVAEITFTNAPAPGDFRLLVEEHEYISADYSDRVGRVPQEPGRLIYAEIFPIG
jgi:hypothetical protein